MAASATLKVNLAAAPAPFSTPGGWQHALVHAAARGQHGTLVQLLQQRPCVLSLDAVRQALGYALLTASERGHVKCCKELLAAADAQGITADVVCAQDGCGCTPLLHASDHGHVATVHTLLTRHAQLQLLAKDGFGRAPLLLTAAKGQLPMLRALLAYSAEEQRMLADNFLCLPLHHAADNGHTECVRELLRLLPSEQLTAKDSFGRTALLLAAEKGQAGAIAVLLDCSPELQAHQLMAPDCFGRTAMLCAAVHQHPGCLQLLCERLLQLAPEHLLLQQLQQQQQQRQQAMPCVQPGQQQHQPQQQQLDRALLFALQADAPQAADGGSTPDATSAAVLKAQCVEHLLFHGARLEYEKSVAGVESVEGMEELAQALDALWPVLHGAVVQARAWNLTVEVVVGLAAEVTSLRQCSASAAAAPDMGRGGDSSCSAPGSPSASGRGDSSSSTLSNASALGRGGSSSSSEPGRAPALGRDGGSGSSVADNAPACACHISSKQDQQQRFGRQGTPGAKLRTKAVAAFQLSRLAAEGDAGHLQLLLSCHAFSRSHLDQALWAALESMSKGSRGDLAHDAGSSRSNGRGDAGSSGSISTGELACDAGSSNSSLHPTTELRTPQGALQPAAVSCCSTAARREGYRICVLALLAKGAQLTLPEGRVQPAALRALWPIARDVAARAYVVDAVRQAVLDR